MSYSLFKLYFKTAVHIGSANGGSSLDDGEMIIRSDTLFGALCCEAAKNNAIDKLYGYFNGEILNTSDTLPFSADELYLPKPILYVERENKEDGDSSIKKELKAIEYIPLSLFEKYIEGLKGGRLNLEDYASDFGQMSVYTRVNKKDGTEPLPYHIGSWRFKPDSGLYIILKSKNEEAKALFCELLTNIGLSGIGGKKTSGLGKFNIEEAKIPSKLLVLLKDTKARHQMLLGTALPKDEELDYIVDNGWYKILRRGGFISSSTYSDRHLKKKTIYMLSAGSVLSKRFAGSIMDLSHKGNHPVWRCANTLFAGVNI